MLRRVVSIRREIMRQQLLEHIVDEMIETPMAIESDGNDWYKRKQS